jgi:hypothetical protein
MRTLQDIYIGKTGDGLEDLLTLLPTLTSLGNEPHSCVMPLGMKS